MRITVPPKQRLPKVSGCITISRSEATQLRDALDLVITTGSSTWNANVRYIDIEASVTLTMELDSAFRRPSK